MALPAGARVEHRGAGGRTRHPSPVPACGSGAGSPGPEPREPGFRTRGPARPRAPATPSSLSGAKDLNRPASVTVPAPARLRSVRSARDDEGDGKAVGRCWGSRLHRLTGAGSRRPPARNEAIARRPTHAPARNEANAVRARAPARSEPNGRPGHVPARNEANAETRDVRRRGTNPMSGGLRAPARNEANNGEVNARVRPRGTNPIKVGNGPRAMMALLPGASVDATFRRRGSFEGRSDRA